MAADATGCFSWRSPPGGGAGGTLPSAAGGVGGAAAAWARSGAHGAPEVGRRVRGACRAAGASGTRARLLGLRAGLNALAGGRVLVTSWLTRTMANRFMWLALPMLRGTMLRGVAAPPLSLDGVCVASLHSHKP